MENKKLESTSKFLLASEWWENLELEEQTNIEKEFGYYGHDIGTTVSDVEYFYTEKVIKPALKWWKNMASENAHTLLCEYKIFPPHSLNNITITQLYIKEFLNAK